MLSFDDLRIPDGWTVVAGFDTGAYMSMALVAFQPDPYAAHVIFEQPNYRYVGGGEIELLGMSNPEWAHRCVAAYQHVQPGRRLVGYVDENSQFKHELNHYGIALLGNPRKLELRVEIAREYVQSTNPVRFYMAPWLTVLPWEMEHAKWPDDTTAAGRFDRLKHHDHTLDCVEHVLSRRPRTKTILTKRKESWLDRYLRENRRVTPRPRIDPHLGRL